MRIAYMLLALVIGSTPAFAQDAARGQQAYAESKCSLCHSIAGEGSKRGVALDGVAAKLSAADIRSWITNAPEMAAKANITRKPPMKAYSDFSKQKVDDLVAYMSTLKK